MVAGANRYGKGLTVKHGEVQDRRPVTGTETIPADQVRTAPRVTVQAPNRHPGSVPAKNMAATAAARPAADPVQRHVQQSGIPHHRTEPTHRPAESEEQTLVHGYPVNKRKLQAFSELLKATETSTTLAEIFTGLCRAEPFAAVRTARRPRASDVSDDKTTHGG